MTIGEYDSLFDRQGGVCAICHKPESAKDPRHGVTKRMAIDHDHETGKVRGLLCQRCNHGIGLFGDVPEILLSAALYLEKQRPRLLGELNRRGRADV